MLKQLFKWFFAARNHDRSESEAKIAALEKKLAELEALVKAQNQKSEEPAAKRDMLPQKPSVQKSAPTVAQKNTPPKQADCFDMIEYFCNGHDDTAVDVILYDQSGNKISRETFSWSSGCGEVTSEGIWRKADDYAKWLIDEGIQLKRSCTTSSPAITIPRSADSSMGTHLHPPVKVSWATICLPIVGITQQVCMIHLELIVLFVTVTIPLVRYFGNMVAVEDMAGQVLL